MSSEDITQRHGSPEATDVLSGEEIQSHSIDVLASGTRVGSFIIDARLAVGGCGTVYAAHHITLNRPVALKVLHAELTASPEMVERFVREVRMVNVIRHPNVVDILDFDQLRDGRPYCVMELLDGITLH